MTSSTLGIAMALGALLASACSASTPPGGREVAGSGEPAPRQASNGSPPTPLAGVSSHAKRDVTSTDDGRVLAMRVGEVRDLHARDPRAPDPRVEGDAVQVVEMFNEQASGGRNWELRAMRPGRSRIAVGDTEPFAVTIEVAPR